MSDDTMYMEDYASLMDSTLEELSAKLSPGTYQGKCEVKPLPGKGIVAFILTELVVTGVDDAATFKKPSNGYQQAEVLFMSPNVGGDGKTATKFAQLKSRFALAGKQLGMDGASKTSDIAAKLNESYVEFRMSYDKGVNKTGEEVQYPRVTWMNVTGLKATSIV